MSLRCLLACSDLLHDVQQCRVVIAITADVAHAHGYVLQNHESVAPLEGWALDHALAHDAIKYSHLYLYITTSVSAVRPATG